MRWLIRRVLKKGKGAVSYEEDTHFGDVLTIGRAADQAIFLPDLRAALNHARVTLLSNGEYKIESLILAGIRVNGEIVYTTTAGADATIEIGNTRLVLLPPPDGYEGGIEVTTLDKGEQKAEKEKRAKPTRLGQTSLRKRWPSWALFTSILLLGLVLPMLGHFHPGLGAFLRASPLPSTLSWNPGTIDAAHHFFAQDCTKCHQTPFRTVRDQACLACHANTAAHADAVKFNMPELGNAECRSCHQDHQGLRGLIRRDQRLCADCHASLKANTKNASSFDDVKDFGKAHPEFKLNLPSWDANGKFAPQRVSFAPNLKENSGLKFNHEKHLKADGLNTPKGRRTLDCAGCHVPEPGGAKMRPVDFEAMCHDCHRLGFDTLAPEREVQHGKVAAVVYEISEYYAKFALEGGYLDAKAPTIVQERRRPGAPPLSQQEQAEAPASARPPPPRPGAPPASPHQTPPPAGGARPPHDAGHEQSIRRRQHRAGRCWTDRIGRDRLRVVPQSDRAFRHRAGLASRTGARVRRVVCRGEIHACQAHDGEVRELPRRAQVERVERRADPRYRQLPRLPRRRVCEGQSRHHLHRLP